MGSINKADKDKYIVRSYRRGDYDFIRQLWIATDMGNPARGDDEKTIEDTIAIGGTLLVLEDKSNGNICGTSWLTFDGRRILLHHFGISPDYQGRGLADLLMEESLKFVKAKNYQVKLEVHTSNTPAINLYRKHGFDRLGDYDVYIIRDLSKI